MPNTFAPLARQKLVPKQTSSGGGTPSGPAGGSLSGNYPNPTLIIDSTPTQGSTNPVTSGGTKTYIDSFVNPTELGTIISDDFNRASIGANWTAVGTPATYSIVGNKLQLTNGSATRTLNNYLRNDGYGTTNLESWQISAQITVGTISATSFGVGLGLQSVGNYATTSVMIGLELSSTNPGAITYYVNNQTSLSDTGIPIGFSITAGDVINMVVRFIKGKFITEITNLNTGRRYTYSKQLTFNNSDFFRCPNASKFSIYSLGGNHQVDNFITYSNDFKNSDLLVCGDSIVGGFTNDAIDQSWARQLMERTGLIIQTNAGEGNVIEDVNVAELISLAPKQLLLLIGFNNAQRNENVATFSPKFAALITALNTGGYSFANNNLKLGLLTPSVFVTALTTNIPLYNTYFISTYGASNCIDLNTPINNGSNGLPSGFTTDNIHPNIFAQSIISDTLEIAYNFKNKFNKNLNRFPILRQVGGKYAVIIDPRYQGKQTVFSFDIVDQGATLRLGNDIGSNSSGGGFFIGRHNAETFGFVLNDAFAASSNNANVVSRTATPSGISLQPNKVNIWCEVGQTVGSSMTPVDRLYVDASTGIVGIAKDNLQIQTAGKGIGIKIGTNARMGTSTLVSGTVTISNTTFTANTYPFLTPTQAGSITSPLRLTGFTSGISFTIASGTPTDTCSFVWLLNEAL